jgi:hypothetical protein
MTKHAKRINTIKTLEVLAQLNASLESLAFYQHEEDEFMVNQRKELIRHEFNLLKDSLTDILGEV